MFFDQEPRPPEKGRTSPGCGAVKVAKPKSSPPPPAPAPASSGGVSARMFRRRVIPFLAVNLFVVGFLIHSVWPLLCLLMINGTNDQIRRVDVPAPNSEIIKMMDRIVPPIIHQTYITCAIEPLLNGSCTTREIPAVWNEAWHSCKDRHPDYEYKLWTDHNSREFIVKEYPWFLDTWDAYEFPIQRADAVRYFALNHYGGVYIDLDDGCQRRLDPLLAFPAWVRRTTPTGIGNDVIGAVPGHPFIQRVIDSLPKYNTNWISPYITIMSSTGPLFFSLIWRQYNKENHRQVDRVRILFPDEYMGYSWSFFSHHLGSSWHMWDADAIFWMGSHWIELTILGFLVGFLVLLGLWYMWNAVAMWRTLTRRAMRRRFPRWRHTAKQEKDYFDLIQRPGV